MSKIGILKKKSKRNYENHKVFASIAEDQPLQNDADSAENQGLKSLKTSVRASTSNRLKRISIVEDPRIEKAQIKLLNKLHGKKTSDISVATIKLAMSSVYRRSFMRQHDAAYNPWMIHPHSNNLMIWDALMAGSICVSMFFVPLRIALYWWEYDFYYKAFMLITEIMSILDIVTHFRTSIETSTCLDSNPYNVAKAYAKSWLIIDMVGALPVDTLVPSVDVAHRKGLKVLKYFRLPKLLRIVKLIRVIRKKAKYYGVLLNLAAFFLVWHLSSCWLMYNLVNCDETPEVCVIDNVWHIYTQALRNTLSTLLLNDNTQQWNQSMYFSLNAHGQLNSGVQCVLILCSLLGLFFVATLLANIFSVVDTFNGEGQRFQAKLSKFKKEMDFFEVSDDIKEHVYMHYDYLWMQRKSFYSMSLLQDPDVSSQIRRKICLFLFKDLVKQVSLFKTVNNDQFVAKVCMNLAMHVYMPGDYVFYACDPSLHFYLINKGSLCVLSNTDDEKVAVLEKGMCFGEVGIIQDLHRSESIISITASEVCTLEKSVFLELQNEYPAFGSAVKALSKNRLSSDVKRRLLSLAAQSKEKHNVAKKLVHAQSCQEMKHLGETKHNN